MLEDNVVSFKHDKIALGDAVGQLIQENKGLSIHLESLERDIYI